MLLDQCIMTCETRAVHLLHILNAQVLYFKCRCAASTVIIEDFSYKHTIGQHKRLSLAREERDPTKWGADGVLNSAPPRWSRDLIA